MIGKRYLFVLFVSFVSFIVCNASPLFQGSLYAHTTPATAGSMQIYRTSNSMLKDASGYARMSSYTSNSQASRLMTINSSYSSSPAIGESGVAVFRYYSKSSGTANVSTGVSGPRRAGPINPDEDEDDFLENPVGEGWLPIVLCLLLYACFNRYRKMRKQTCVEMC